MLIRFWFGQLHVGRTSGVTEYPYDAAVTLCLGWRGDVPPQAPKWRHIWRLAWNWLPDRKYRSLRPTIKLPPTEGEVLEAALAGREPRWIEVEDKRGVDSVTWTGRSRKFLGFGAWRRKFVSYRATWRSLMHVYLTGAKERANPSHMMYLAPAATMPQSERPAEWLEHDGAPKNFTVQFVFGRASVDERLGEWMVKTGVAKKTNLIRAAGGSVLGSLAKTIAGR